MNCNRGTAFRRLGSAVRCQRRGQVEVELVDEHHALHALGCLGTVELVEHDGTEGDVGNQRDEHMVAVGQLGPWGGVSVLETHDGTGCRLGIVKSDNMQEFQ